MDNVTILNSVKRHRPLNEIGDEILLNWHNPSPHAVPYAHAMLELDQITDMYHLDTAESVILRFGCNAQQWRGEKARAIKLELKDIIKMLKENPRLQNIATQNHTRVYNL